MTIIKTPLEGGCQCGKVRYRSEVRFDNSHLCHCRMCQKAVGNLFAALVATPEDELKWLKEEPSVFASSEVADRGFCSSCGTPLFYRERGANRVNLTLGSLDDPSAFAPKGQVGTESKIAWVDDLHKLPDGGTTESNMPAEVTQRIRSTNAQYSKN